MSKDNSSHRFMAKVPNTDEGWSKIEALKGIINKDRYRLVYKYNGKSIPGIYKRGYYSCIKEYATEVRVYLNVKDAVRDSEFMAKNRWEMNRELREEERRHERRLFEIEESCSWYLHNK